MCIHVCAHVCVHVHVYFYIVLFFNVGEKNEDLVDLPSLFSSSIGMSGRSCASSARFRSCRAPKVRSKYCWYRVGYRIGAKLRSYVRSPLSPVSVPSHVATSNRQLNICVRTSPNSVGYWDPTSRSPPFRIQCSMWVHCGSMIVHIHVR